MDSAASKRGLSASMAMSSTGAARSTAQVIEPERVALDSDQNARSSCVQAWNCKDRLHGLAQQQALRVGLEAIAR